MAIRFESLKPLFKNYRFVFGSFPLRDFISLIYEQTQLLIQNWFLGKYQNRMSWNKDEFFIGCFSSPIEPESVIFANSRQGKLLKTLEYYS